jgi:drug/metabolite transporter (DMT)-like permease
MTPPRGVPSGPAHATASTSREARGAGLGIALGLLAPVLWSSSGLFVKILPLAPVPLAALRALLAGAALAPFVRPRALRLAELWTVAGAGMLVSYTLSVLCYISAVRLTTAANAIALVSTAPAWVVALTWLAERRVRWVLAWPVGLVLAGVAVMLAEPAVGRSLEGNLLGLAGGLAFGLFTFTLPRVRMPVVGRVAACNLIAGAALFLASPAQILAVRLAPLDWLALAYLGAIQIGLATVCFAFALTRISAAEASVLALLEPLLAPLWVYLAIGEAPSAFGAAGGVFILGGIGVDLFVRRLRRGRP